MKKLFSILLVAMLIVTSLATVAFAAGSATVSANSVNAKAGDEVTISFTLSGDKFASYGMQITADANLTLTGIQQGPASNGAFVGNAKNGVVGFGATYNCDPGVIFTATFKVSANAKPGKYPVNVIMDFVADEKQDDLSVGVAGGYVIITCDHSWGKWVTVTEPTCTEDGKAERTCANCSDVETKVLPATDHSWGNWTTVTKPTCTKEGKAERTCANCKDVESKVLPATDHDISTKWSHDDDNHWHTCANGCGEFFDLDEHDLEWIVTKNPTHIHTGLKHQECKVCDYKGADVDIPADPNLDDVPGTGDITPMVNFTVVAILSMLAAVAYLIKRKFAK